MDPFDHSDISLQTSINSKIHENFQDPHKSLSNECNTTIWLNILLFHGIFLRITSNDSFVQKKIDGHVYSIQVQGWLRTFSGSYHTIQFMYSFDTICSETLTISIYFGLFQIIQQHIHHLYQRICNHSDFLQDFLTSLSDSNVGYRLS